VGNSLPGSLLNYIKFLEATLPPLFFAVSKYNIKLSKSILTITRSIV